MSGLAIQSRNGRITTTWPRAATPSSLLWLLERCGGFSRSKPDRALLYHQLGKRSSPVDGLLYLCISTVPRSGSSASAGRYKRSRRSTTFARPQEVDGHRGGGTATADCFIVSDGVDQVAEDLENFQAAGRAWAATAIRAMCGRSSSARTASLPQPGATRQRQLSVWETTAARELFLPCSSHTKPIAIVDLHVRQQAARFQRSR